MNLHQGNSQSDHTFAFSSKLCTPPDPATQSKSVHSILTCDYDRNTYGEMSLCGLKQELNLHLKAIALALVLADYTRSRSRTRTRTRTRTCKTRSHSTTPSSKHAKTLPIAPSVAASAPPTSCYLHDPTLQVSLLKHFESYDGVFVG